MIEGVTKPFTLDRPPLSESIQRAAAAAYIAGMHGLFNRLGHGNIDLDFAESDAPVTSILLLEFNPKSDDYNTNPGTLIANAPDTQVHVYGIDHDGVLRRTDSKLLIESVLQVPQPEQFSGTPRERFLHAIQQSQREQSLGINGAPVDEEEITKLFAIIDREYPA